MKAHNKILNMDALSYFQALPDNGLDCIITSPPYYGQRDYGVDGQIGLEKSINEYVQKLVAIFREGRRALKNEGTLWLNIGDSYVGANSQHKENGSFGETSCIAKGTQKSVPQSGRVARNRVLQAAGLKMKNLLMVPARVALALQADGWILRNDIIWHKPNSMPESMKDRFTQSYEHVYLFSKQQKYYFNQDAVREPAIYAGDNRRLRTDNLKKHLGQIDIREDSKPTGDYRNRRDVWTIATKPFGGSHFAAFPPDLIEPMILAGCPPDGLVCDCFMGAGTTGLVARRLNRNFTGCELNPEYIALAEKRIQEDWEANQLSLL